MRIGIVGAGAAGLAAARELVKKGNEVVIYEKGAIAGGRIATQHVGPYVFDTGATSIAPRKKAIEKVMLEELPTDQLVPVTKPIYVHQYGRVMPGDVSRANVPRYTYLHGNATFPALLAEDLDVRENVTVDRLRSQDQQYEISGDLFDAIILTAPVPESEDLLATLGESRKFANVRYRACLSVLLGFAVDIGEVHYHAIIDVEQRHPLTWLSLESIKCPGRAPKGHTAMVAQLSPAYSAQYYESSESTIIEDTVSHVARLYGKKFDAPCESEVVRWRYSQPETTAAFETVNRVGSRLLVASDGVLGGRVELAYEVGVMAAQSLME